MYRAFVSHKYTLILINITYNNIRMNRMFFDDFCSENAVVIPRPRFIQEHKKLLQVLRDRKPQELEKERKDQAEELDKMLDGGSRNSGYVQMLISKRTLDPDRVKKKSPYISKLKTVRDFFNRDDIDDELDTLKTFFESYLYSEKTKGDPSYLKRKFNEILNKAKSEGVSEEEAIKYLKNLAYVGEKYNKIIEIVKSKNDSGFNSRVKQETGAEITARMSGEAKKILDRFEPNAYYEENWKKMSKKEKQQAFVDLDMIVRGFDKNDKRFSAEIRGRLADFQMPSFIKRGFNAWVKEGAPSPNANVKGRAPNTAYDKQQRKGLKGKGTRRDNFLEEYGLEDRSYSLKELSKISAVPLSILQEVYDRGVGAYKTNPESVRLKGSFVKNVAAPMSKKLSKEQWAMARVYSFLDGNPKHDNDLRRNKS